MIDIFIQILPVTIFSIVTSITPGPNNIMLATSGANVGYKKTLPLLFGIAFGFLTFLLFTTFGLNILFDMYPNIYIVFKVLGSLYLLYLAFTIINSALNEQKIKILGFKQAIIFQYINPKVWGMSLTAITSFSLSGDNYLISALIISFWFILIYLPCGFVWILFGSALKRLFLTNKRRYKQFNILMGLLLVLTSYFIFNS